MMIYIATLLEHLRSFRFGHGRWTEDAHQADYILLVPFNIIERAIIVWIKLSHKCELDCRVNYCHPHQPRKVWISINWLPIAQTMLGRSAKTLIHSPSSDSRELTYKGFKRGFCVWNKRNCLSSPFSVLNSRELDSQLSTSTATLNRRQISR